MANDANTSQWIGGWGRAALIASLVVAGLAILTCVLLAVVAGINGVWSTMAAYIVLLAALVAAGLWCVVLHRVLGVIVRNEEGVQATAQRLSRVESLLESQIGSLRKLVELESLSDRAKSLVFREAETQALREAIHHEVMQQNYDGAAKIIDAAERQLGYGPEAEKLRGELTQSQQRSLGERIDAAVARIDDLVASQDWPAAYRQAQRLMGLFPDDEKVQGLPERITTARNEYKRGLLTDYAEAVRRNDVDRGIELLHRLDAYLTPQEEPALEESARGVFKEKLHTLGVQFSILVSDHRWSDALTTGEQIIREFPNSRMAQEVREKLDLLRSHAAQGAPGSGARTG